ncbi:MAG TPA: hypothetical protein VMO47_15270 [Rhodothermales bacterium]|nr:hypothetical protein [Rhodothermales bacterium]
MTILRSFLCLYVVVASTAASAWDVCLEDMYTEVLRSEDIARSGAVRFTDLLALSDRWVGFSVDGYDWEISPSGLGLTQHQRFRVFVDDKPIPVALLGKSNLNLLPFHLHEVECVAIVSGPDARGPYFSPYGSIRIYTKHPEFGVTLHGGVSAGNEIDDPGPFHYTPMDSPNIDRLGPIGTVDISAASGRAFARLSGTVDEFHVTDDQVDLRAKQLYDADFKPRINLESQAFTARGGGQSVVLGRTTADDLLFFPSFGMEIPSTHNLEFAAASGYVEYGRASLEYHGGYLTHDLDRRGNARNLRLDWGERRVLGGLAAAVKEDWGGTRVGGSVESVGARTTQALSDPIVLITRLDAGVTVNLGRWRQAVFGQWSQADARPAAAGLYRAAFDIDSLNTLALAISYGRHLTESEGGLWIWAGRGFELPQPDSGVTAVLPFEPSPRMLTADLEWRTRPLREVSATARAYFRWFDGEYLPLHDLGFDAATAALVGNTSVIGGISGAIAGGGFTVDFSPISALRQRVTYNAEFPVHGDRNVTQSWNRIPDQRFIFTSTYSPVERFSLFARFDYRMATSWASFDRVAVESSGRYPAEFSDFLLLDVAASKRLWKDHLRATLVVRNLMNEPVRYHPTGAIFNMAFHFAVQVYFNSESGL